jgi:hypothetical protein
VRPYLEKIHHKKQLVELLKVQALSSSLKKKKKKLPYLVIDLLVKHFASTMHGAKSFCIGYLINPQSLLP